MTFSLSDKDKKLLLVLAIVAVICLPYFFVIQPLLDKNAAIAEEILELQSRKDYLTDLKLNESVYQEKTEEMAVETENLLSRFPSELPQEASILFIDNTEKMIPIKLHQVTFGEDVAAQITSDAEKEQIDAVEKEMGDVTDDEVIEEVTETVAISGNLSGIATETQFAFEAGYNEYKEFLKYILDYQDRMVITGMTATYSMDVVTGSFTLRQYAISGEGRLPVKILEPNLMHGTTNVFLQAAGVGSSSEDSGKKADFFMLLNPPDADVETIIIGQSSDASEETYLVSDENAQTSVNLTFEGSEGQYTANYKIGRKSYSEEGIPFVKSGMIDFEIISSPRNGDSDKAGIKLSVVNNTDLTVNISVLDDDTENPRVIIAEKTGIVVMPE